MSQPQPIDVPQPVDQNPEAGEKPQDVRGKSQGQLVRQRFFGNTGAVVSLVVLLFIVVLSVSSLGIGPIPGWWKWSPDATGTVIDGGRPTLSLLPPGLGEHPFGQDNLGRDLFAMAMQGTQYSLVVMIVVGLVAGIVGTVVGGLSGYFRGWTEAVLMRLTDVIIIIPLVILAALLGRLAISWVRAHGLPTFATVIALGLLIGLASWPPLARLVRGEFLTLREREFVDAARLAGASSGRIIFKHILPNTVGVITVNITLLMSSAILLETALSYLGLGIQAPDWSLGRLISENQTAFATRPWLFWWPGVFIVAIALTINFIGDGLRDAFDPRQRKFNPKRAREIGSGRDEHARDAVPATMATASSSSDGDAATPVTDGGGTR
ncbi:ABC transporter permease [Glutamicibacter protophormiae]|uniref:Oligopeptide transport system permease protein OppC n=1 Tax=Kocuria varians TaxID=1272 RepID=A0A7D7L0D9_KOCVA|nr:MULTISPECIES: ABC transporter permease [Kocuria]WNB89274.1 ABC transporter permease [Glutamicibacter protophormiae]MDN5631422.1 ABC transporter permease [Kocuria sp.]QMS57605.1 Oligopeptide transport system permease protein OppC [Kocuria varians]RUP81170.1 ABC transporter permease [Kocuria sp. HSID17590]RUQ04841.1 ABC transporter permease [Kocuria sp. HSID17582]